MKCDICNSEGVHIRNVTRTYGKGEELLIIENLPIISCLHCGESYITAETLHRKIFLAKQSPIYMGAQIPTILKR